MCGIVGIYNFKSSVPVDVNRFKDSTNLLEHRGPDGAGFHFEDAVGLGLGHRRLSIIDLSTGDQPMCNEDGTIWIVYNGELYNYLDLKEYLLQRQHKFKTQSDTEVIIHAYEEFGESCTNRFNGIFAFALWDSKNRKLFLARDHFGVKPLYYAFNDNGVVFASEMKSILHYTKMQKELNLEALHLCLTFRHTPAPHTFIRTVQKLPAAHWMSVSDQSGIVLKSYWDREIVIDHSRQEDEWIHLLRTNFEKAVQRQMMADVPVGISLSGGVDSGAILSLMTRYAGQGVHAFTVSFEGGKTEDDETARAQANAARFGAAFHQRRVTAKDYADFLERYLWHLEEPVGNESAAAYYFVAEMAKGVVKVILNGQGADEPFAGYDRYLGMYYSGKIPFLSAPLARFLSLLPLNLDRRNQFRRLSEFLSQRDEYAKIASVASITTPTDRALLFGDELTHYSRVKREDDAVGVVRKILGTRVKGNLLEKMLFYDMFSSLSENLLLSEDKMAMAASIEARVPFLDVEFASTALTIPASLKIKRFHGKYIHKKVCEAYLPKEIVYQPKIGFNNPVEKWLKASLGEKLMDYVLSQNSISRHYLHIPYITKLYNDHKRGNADHQRLLFLLLSIEQWGQQFLPHSPGV